MQVPEGFRACVSRGSSFQAAAMSFANGGADVFIAYEFVAGTLEASAWTKFSKQLAKGGTIGSKFLPNKAVLQKIFSIGGAGWVTPVFTPAEIMVDKVGLLRASIVEVAPALVVRVPRDDFATLGLVPEAGREQIKAAFHRAILQHHPDKGGDPDKFRAANDAYERLTATTLVDATTPKQPNIPAALTYEASPEALLEQMLDARERTKVAKAAYDAARRHEWSVTRTYGEKHGDVQKAIRRDKAQKFTKQFQKTAKFWDIAELMRWFQPRVGLWSPKSSTDELRKESEAKCKMYGEDLRSGNEDLDPKGIKFMAWHPRFGGNPMCLGLSIKVGLDFQDAVEHGHQFTIEYSALCKFGKGHEKTLTLMGFDWEYARSREYERWRYDFDIAHEARYMRKIGKADSPVASKRPEAASSSTNLPEKDPEEDPDMAILKALESSRAEDDGADEQAELFAGISAELARKRQRLL